MPSGTRAELLRRAEQQQPGLAVGDGPLRLPDHDRLGAGAADPAVQLAARGDDGARALLAGRRALPPDHGGQRELLAAAGQLAGLLDHVPGPPTGRAALIRRRPTSPAGAPDTSWRSVSAS